jgi:metallo-beta-lactamase class B
MREMKLAGQIGVYTLTVLAFSGQNTQAHRESWNKPFPPFRIIGNLYYVGASGVSSFLIATPEGNILLDGGLIETASQIERNVAALGFRMQDVKYLLNSHAHYDHCGGLAELKRASSARMVASAADASTLSSGFQQSYGPGQSATRFPAVKVDRLVSDGETVSVGGARLTAHITPGHTKGCTTWTMPVSENGKTYQVIFYCSTTVAGNQLIQNPKYPRIVDDYEHSFAVLRSMQCDLFLAPHPEFFRMSEKVERRARGGSNPFIDRLELPEFVKQSQESFEEELAKQRHRSDHVPAAQGR